LNITRALLGKEVGYEQHKQNVQGSKPYRNLIREYLSKHIKSF